MPKQKIAKANQRTAATTLRGNLCIAQSIPSYLAMGSINDLIGSSVHLAEGHGSQQERRGLVESFTIKTYPRLFEMPPLHHG